MINFNSYLAPNHFKDSLHFLIKTPQKWAFPLRLPSVNVTKSIVSGGFGHIMDNFIFCAVKLFLEACDTVTWIFGNINKINVINQ